MLSSYDYDVNALGQRTAVTANGTAFSGGTAPSWTWSYNAAGEVTSGVRAGSPALDRTYAYDGIGNRKMSRDGAAQAVGYEVAAANSTNAYTALFADTDGDGVRDAGEATTASPTHDADGNMTWDGVSGTAGRRFTWDGENRLVQVHNADATPQLLATYTYDYRSRRVQKVTTSTAPQGAQTRRYVYDGWNCIAEYDAAASLLARHDWGLDLSGSFTRTGGVGALVRTTTAGLQCYPTYDANGNVTEVTTSTGSSVARFEYDPFGNEVYAAGYFESVLNYRFSTKPRDRETGFNYYGYRYYSAGLGRWLNRDPKGESGGTMLYRMVENSPVGKVDRLGLTLPGPMSPPLVAPTPAAPSGASAPPLTPPPPGSVPLSPMTGVTTRIGSCCFNPFRAGSVTFDGFSPMELNSFQIIPEDWGVPGYAPSSGGNDDVDGFHVNGTPLEWFKIPRHCYCTVKAIRWAGALRGVDITCCCNMAMSLDLKAIGKIDTPGFFPNTGTTAPNTAYPF